MRLLICLIFCLLFLGCEEEKVQPKVQEIKRTYKGDVELLNSCGMDGAASKMRTYLRKNGFDVVSTKNDPVVQNYEQTVLVLRNPEWEGAQPLAKALKTKNVITVISKRALVDASVYIGKDLKQIVEPEQGE